MNDYKKDLLIITAKDIGDYLLKEHGVDVDYLDIVELVNFNLGSHITVEDDEETEEAGEIYGE